MNIYLNKIETIFLMLILIVFVVIVNIMISYSIYYIAKLYIKSIVDEKSKNNKYIRNNMKIMIRKNDYDQQKLKLSYSDDLLKFIREYVTQVSIIKFHEYIDGKDLSKITRFNMITLTKDTAIEAKHGITDVLDISYSIFTEDIIDKYIINVSSITLKKLLREAVENY